MKAAEAHLRVPEYLEAAKCWQCAATAYERKENTLYAGARAAAAVAYTLVELPAKAQAAWLAAATGWTWVAGDAKANPELAADARGKAAEAYPQGRDQVKVSELYQWAVRGCALVANASHHGTQAAESRRQAYG